MPSWTPHPPREIKRTHKRQNPTLAALDLVISNLERMIEEDGEWEMLKAVRMSLGLPATMPNGDDRKTYEEMREHVHDFLNQYGLGK